MNKVARQILTPAIRAAAAVDPAVADRATAALAILDGREPSATDSLLLNQADTARALRVSRFTVRNLVIDGKLTPIRIRGANRFRRVDVEKLAMGE